MKRLHLHRLLWRNVTLCERRSPMFERLRATKAAYFIIMAIPALYLFVMGVLYGGVVPNGKYDEVFCLMPFFLALDFVFRIGMQQTPSMLLKPYLLLPVRRTCVVDSFLLVLLFNAVSLLWLFFFVPYVAVCVIKGMTVWQAVATVLLGELMVVANGEWYVFVRSLAQRRSLWWLLAVVVYALPFVGCFFDGEEGLEAALDFVGDNAFTPIGFAAVTLALVVLFIANRSLLLSLSLAEESNVEKTKVATPSGLSILGRFGIVGEYLKLEVKSALRNKAVRQLLVTGVAITVLLTLLVAYTETYEGLFARNIWCLYSFLIIGWGNLARLMGMEGNYIDMLMVHYENIYSLLRAKYYFYCALLVVPALLLIPAMIEGKYPLLMVLAYFLLTCGPLYCALFQLAVYNNQTFALNHTISGKSSFDNMAQTVIGVLVFTVPAALSWALSVLLGETAAYIVLIVVGIAFTATHNLWLRNIYTRLMARKYVNMEGFHSTR